jgi:predicted transcriptional regulator
MKNLLGKILQETLQKEGSASVKDFAMLMSMSPRTVYNIFDGSSSMTFEQVIKASEILGFDVAGEYYRRSGKPSPSDVFSQRQPSYTARVNTKSNNTVSVSLSITGPIDSYDNFPKLLAYIKEKSTEFGFDVD